MKQIGEQPRLMGSPVVITSLQLGYADINKHALLALIFVHSQSTSPETPDLYKFILSTERLKLRPVGS